MLRQVYGIGKCCSNQYSLLEAGRIYINVNPDEIHLDATLIKGLRV